MTGYTAVVRLPSHRLGRLAGPATLLAAFGLLGLLALPFSGRPASTGATAESDGPGRLRQEVAGERPVGLLRGRPTAPQQARLLEGQGAHLPPVLAGPGPLALVPARIGLVGVPHPRDPRLQAAPARLVWRGGEAGTSRAPPSLTSL